MSDDLAARLEATEGVLRDMQSDSYAYLAGQEDGRRWERQELYDVIRSLLPRGPQAEELKEEMMTYLETRQDLPGTLHLSPRRGRVFTDTVAVFSDDRDASVKVGGVALPGVTQLTLCFAAGELPAFTMSGHLTPPKPLDD